MLRMLTTRIDGMTSRIDNLTTEANRRFETLTNDMHKRFDQVNIVARSADCTAILSRESRLRRDGQAHRMRVGAGPAQGGRECRGQR